MNKKTIRDIDWTETIRTGCRFENVKLVRRDGAHGFREMIRGSKRVLDLGGMAFGAFDGGRLVALAVHRPELWSAMGRLAGLHVSNGYRR